MDDSDLRRVVAENGDVGWRRTRCAPTLGHLEPLAYAKRASVRYLYATTPLEMNDINPGTLFKGKTKHLRAYIKTKAYKVSSLTAT